MAKLLFRLWLCLFALPSFAGNIICTNADFTGNPQTLRVVYVFYLDAPTSTYTNIITRDRLRYTNDSTGYFIITNYYPGNYRFEFNGTFTVTTNWFNFPATNGTVNAADPQWGSGPTNGIVLALTRAAGDTRYAPIGLNHSNRVFYIATNGVTATAIMNNRDAPYPITNLTVNPPLIATQQGDLIKVLPGNYYLSNNAPLRIAQGVTLEGVGLPIFHVDTNGPDNGRLDFSTFQPKDNSTIRGIVWEATNTWNTTDSGGHQYASFLLSGPVFTNVLVENCFLYGGSDVFYSTNGPSTKGLVMSRSVVSSLWDFFSSGSESGLFVSDHNIWIGLGAQSRPSRVNNGNLELADYGSAFFQFAGWDGVTYGISGTFSPHGTVFKLSAPCENFVLAAYAKSCTGDYYDANTGKSFSIGPEGGEYYTNAFTTNFVYTLNPTNIYVSAGTPDANLNGRYQLGTTDNALFTGTSFWTNQSHTTYVLWLNDPAAVADEGGVAFSIRSSGGAMIAEGAGAGFAGRDAATGYVTNQTNESIDLEDGSSTCTMRMATNSIATNQVNVLVPTVFNRNLIFATNTLWAGSGKYYGGDGRYLTNLTVVTTDWHTNGNTAINPQSFIGTTDAVGLKIKANNSLAGYFDTANNVWFGKFNTNYSGTANFIAGGLSNSIGVSGGANGNYNTIQGGLFNSIGQHQLYCFIGGGFNNLIADNASDGGFNSIFSGQNNIIGNACSYAAVLWGSGNTATNLNSGGAVGGTRGVCTNSGSVVLTDSQNADFSSLSSDRMRTRFQGGYDFTGGSVGITGIASATNGVASYVNNKAAPTSITVGASVFNYTNTTAVNIQVFLDANGATTAVTFNGAAIFGSLVAGDHTIIMQPGDRIGVTYSVATPVMKYREF